MNMKLVNIELNTIDTTTIRYKLNRKNKEL